MSLVLLSAGNATRLGDRAPNGCKALARVGGRTMIDWWADVDPRVIVVCRTEHTKDWRFPSESADVISCDEGGGPAVALRAALPHVQGPLTVAYADTWVPQAGIPTGTDWCGVAAAKGGRCWDVLEDDVLTYRHVHPGKSALVAVGLYRFSDLERLAKAIDTAIEMGSQISPETGMAGVVNLYGASFRPVLGWQDVGDVTALNDWKALA